VSQQDEDVSGAFRQAMRGYPAAVVIVTAEHGGERFAMTMTAAMSLTMDPASLVLAVNRKASIYPALELGAKFCVNLLRDRHRELSRVCSASEQRHARFEAGEFALKDGVPYLADAQASIFCAPNGRYLFGTHSLVIGKVEAVRVGEAVDPLLYLGGDYLSCGGAGLS
jgi:flavin reductase (DIM6/NTAB) family NADH-FMN oxidoreductase RutF